MKHFWALLLFLFSCSLYACPTCVGTIKKESPPFFKPAFLKKGSS